MWTTQLLKLGDKDIVEMVFFPVVNEACRVLAEGISVKSSDLDIASIFGMGFPPYRSNYNLPFFCTLLLLPACYSSEKYDKDTRGKKKKKKNPWFTAPNKRIGVMKRTGKCEIVICLVIQTINSAKLNIYIGVE